MERYRMCMDRFNRVKMDIVLVADCRLNAIPIKIAEQFFTDLEMKQNFVTMWITKKTPQDYNINLEKQKKF